MIKKLKRTSRKFLNFYPHWLTVLKNGFKKLSFLSTVSNLSNNQRISQKAKKGLIGNMDLAEEMQQIFQSHAKIPQKSPKN
jgi:hypothetical protein